MVPGSDLPRSLLSLLTSFQHCFTRPMYLTFCSLVRGFIAQTGERTVCGMLTGAGFARRWHHTGAHRFFSHRRWSVDSLSLQLAVLLVTHLLPGGSLIELVVDDTLFRRPGRKIFGAR